MKRLHIVWFQHLRFWNKQNHGDSKKINGCQRLKGREVWTGRAQRIFTAVVEKPRNQNIWEKKKKRLKLEHSYHLFSRFISRLIMQYQQNDWHVDQWNRTGYVEINPYTYSTNSIGIIRGWGNGLTSKEHKTNVLGYETISYFNCSDVYTMECENS